MRKSILASALAVAALLAGCSKPHERLVVYTAAEADQIQPYTDSFKKARPDIDLVWVRDSTGVVTAKLLAEQKAPQADVVFALAATSMMKLDDAGLLAPYAQKGLESVDARFRDGRPVPHWTGEALWSAAICVNTDEMRKRNLPTPTSWEDLTKPIYKGLVSMPDPASSGTGLLAVAAWLQLNGEEKGWAYMDRLNPNISAYVHSGSKPCKDVSRGEIPIGISIDFRAAQATTQGLPVEVVIPKEGVGWDLEATGLVTGTKHADAAKAFIDWAFSKDAMALYAKNFGVVGDRSMPTSPILPADLRDHLAPVDLKWTAANRDRILTEWAKRYGAKSEPKS